MPSRRLQVARTVGVVVTATLLLLLLLEAGARIAGRIADGAWPVSRAGAFHRDIVALRAIYRRHPYLNTAPRAGGKVEVFGYSASLSSSGHRSPERPVAKAPGARRIVLAGGSAVFDVLAPSDELSWPQRLERALAAELPGVEVWNGGFPGWTTQESLIALAIRDLDLEPEVVLVVHGANDLQPAAHLPFDPQYENGHAEIALRATGLDLPPPWPFERLVAIDRLSDLLFEPSNPWKQLEARRGPTDARRPTVAIDALRVYERNLRSLAALTQARGARLLLATQPMRIRERERAADLAWLAGWIPGLEPERAPAELARLNEVTRRLAGAGVARLVDLEREIDWEDADFGDPLHFSEPGREKLLRHLQNVLRESLRDGDTPRPLG